MIRNLALASVITLAAGAAQAAPQLVGGGEDSAVIYTAPSQNVVGGARAQISGGGENRSITAEAVQARPGRDVFIVGGGEDRRFVTGTAEGSVVLAQSLTRSQGR
ncbi:hypothetical protein [Paracraurococcus lichenis]|uniref:Uncharacterized protein n=1 Tax=Paracraurococcus lichenis TaxID=3064888 RepID=A0ABT9E2Z2_9PROT|nr:hypothetical protein [Paracraurococcus sp. LOR1-02]MDO9710465.1 hypothetical protein [Paracraurococcus sp. LOR1-02]